MWVGRYIITEAQCIYQNNLDCFSLELLPISLEQFTEFIGHLKPSNRSII